MTQITLKGNPIHTIGNLPNIGQKAPVAKFTLKDLSDVHLDHYKNKKVILNFNAQPNWPTYTHENWPTLSAHTRQPKNLEMRHRAASDSESVRQLIYISNTKNLAALNIDIVFSRWQTKIRRPKLSPTRLSWAARNFSQSFKPCGLQIVFTP